MTKILIIRTRSAPRENREADETLKRLGVEKRYSYSIRENNQSTVGMMQKVQHLLTWGEVSADIEKKLSKAKNGLHPPRGGFERKGVKVPYARGGVFGDRKELINKLAERMLP